ncbi:MAG: PAS domain-containing protein, partial [Kiritimatiellae bacterium]|nr:PAS domain-containing protein [Kiritimatiellia bacterium]
MRGPFWHKLIERLDRLDAASVQSLVERLVSSHGILETVFHALREGVLVLDADARIAYANHAAARLLNVPEGTLDGQPAATYLPAIDWTGWLAAAATAPEDTAPSTPGGASA